MRNLHAYDKVGHTRIERWLRWTSVEGLDELHAKAKAAESRVLAEKSSHFLWVDGTQYQLAKRAAMEDVKRSRRQADEKGRPGATSSSSTSSTSAHL